MRLAHLCRARNHLVVVFTLVAGCLSVAGCGHGSASAQAGAPPAIAAAPIVASSRSNTDWALVPLTRDDALLYLEVMRAAAERIHHPPPGDLAALKLEKSAMAKVQQGHPEQITQAEIDVSDLTTELEGHVDDLIVADRHLDAGHYARIVDRVEDAVVPPQFDFEGDGDALGSAYVPTAHDRAVDAARNANVKLLAPWRDEIRALETVVRDTQPRL